MSEILEQYADMLLPLTGGIAVLAIMAAGYPDLLDAAGRLVSSLLYR